MDAMEHWVSSLLLALSMGWTGAAPKPPPSIPSIPDQLKLPERDFKSNKDSFPGTECISESSSSWRTTKKNGRVTSFQEHKTDPRVGCLGVTDKKSNKLKFDIKTSGYI